MGAHGGPLEQSPPPTSSGPDIPQAEGAAAADATRGSAVKLGAETLGRVLALATTLYVARSLGVADFGVFATLSGIAVILAEVGDLGLHVTASRALAVGELPLSAMVRARLVLGGLTIVLLAGLFTGWPVLASLVLYFALSGWSEFLGVALRARGAPLAEAAVILAMRAAGLVLVFAAAAGGGGLARICWALAASPLPAVGLGAALLARTHGPSEVAPAASVASVLRASFPVAVNGVLALASLRIELFALAAFREARAAGLFAAAMKVIEVLNMVPAAVVAGAMPALAREGLRAQGPVRDRTATTVALMGVPAALGLVLVAPELAARLYGPEFSRAAAPLRVLALSLAVLFMNTLLLHALLAAGRARWMPVLTGIRVAAAALFALVLVPRLGELGAAGGFLASELLLLLLAARACRNARFAVPLAGPLLRALAASLPMAAAVALAGAGLVVSVALGALVYAATLGLAWRLAPRAMLRERMDVHCR
jgi:O-antigen/teichoic acid export membrane protein